MQDLILTLHIIVCVILVVLVLLQSGKEGMGVIFGGGNSSVFGTAGAGGILAKLTTLMAIIFVITSLSYTYVTSSRPAAKSSILDVRIEDMPPAAETPKTPAQPEAANGQTPAQNKNQAPEQAGTGPEEAAAGQQTPAEGRQTEEKGAWPEAGAQPEKPAANNAEQPKKSGN